MTAVLEPAPTGPKSHIPWQAFSPTDAAKVAGVGRTAIYEAISAGDLRARRIGKRTRIDIHDLYDWFHGHNEAGDQQK